MRGTMIAALNRPARRARGGWTPAELSNLELWLRPEDLGADESLVSSWPDQSGNGRDLAQSTQASQPQVVASALDGYSAASFDGTDDHLLVSTTMLSAGEITVACVLKQAETQGNNGLFNQPYNSITEHIGILATFGNSLYFDVGNTNTSSAGGRINVAQPTGWDDAFHYLLCMRDSSDNQSISVDQSELISATRQKTVTNPGSQEFRLGFYTSSKLKGEIVELVICSVGLASADLASLESYLASRYPSLGIS